MKKKVWLIILAVILVIGVITAVFVIRNNQNKANTYQCVCQPKSVAKGPPKGEHLPAPAEETWEAERRPEKLIRESPLTMGAGAVRLSRQDNPAQRGWSVVLKTAPEGPVVKGTVD